MSAVRDALKRRREAKSSSKTPAPSPRDPRDEKPQAPVSTPPAPPERHQAEDAEARNANTLRAGESQVSPTPAAPTLAKQKPKRDTYPDGGRLPNASEFLVAYDSATQTWSGTLRIGDATFTGQASGVFRLLKDLDRQYRASLAPSGSAPTASDAAATTK